MKVAEKYLGDWIDSVKCEEPISAKVSIGWAKIAWSYGMRELA